jgi:cellobiose epimerase
MKNFLQQYSEEVSAELHRILDYWMKYTIDKTDGGFYGSVNNNNQPKPGAEKGIVLHGRILWTFSTAYSREARKEYLEMAQRAYDYIMAHFKDIEHGGVYWSVDAKGNMLDSRKQIYGIAFCLYGMSAYYAASKNEAALSFAKDLFSLIEKYSYDSSKKGYMEAFTREWKDIDNASSIAKNAKQKKTMNTHLHLIEAYASLYKVWPDATLKQRIAGLLEVFDLYFIDHAKYFNRLFFDENWKEQPDVISYGHDIESAWLLLQCAQVINDAHWTDVFKDYAVKIADAVHVGIGSDGSIWYEYNPATGKINKQRDWWPQAEGMVGYINAYQLTCDEKYLHQSIKTWSFVKEKILDLQNGEWFWGRKEDNSLVNADKAGFWKCPYHNSRACMEVMDRSRFCR